MKRWAQVFAVAMFINTSYGTLSYAFSVLISPDAAGGAFGARTVSLGFGAALLVSGIASLGAGTLADLFGSRRLMAGGSVLGAVALCLLAGSREPWQAVAVMALVVGPAMAATFYEPVYVLMNRWFAPAERPKAYGVLTFFSGFSITIYTPLTRWLVDAAGWRGAVVALAGILFAVGMLVPALISEPARATEGRQSFRRLVSETRAGLRQGDRAFWLFTLLFFVATVAFSGFSFHMIAQLESRGFEKTDVANAIAITGIVSLPARLLLPAASGRVSSSILLAACFMLLAVAAVIASAAQEWWHVWVYIAVFGAVFGAVYPLRALVTSDRFAGEYFGRMIGAQALFIAVGRALGPATIGQFADNRRSYQVAFQIAGLVLLLSAVGMVLLLAYGARDRRGREISDA
ncbi:MAG: MFS transporter [Tepidiformaceae bacterium]